LTGSVAWDRDPDGTRRVRVSPELVEVAASGAPRTRWHQSFDTTLANVFGVQAAVATQVVDRLGIVLSPPAQTQLAARPTQSAAAYDAYLRGMGLSQEGSSAAYRAALAALEEAVALDSGFAAAWARIGMFHASVYAFGTATREDSIVSHQAAERAIALAPTVADGYEARGWYQVYVERDPSAALATFRTAVRLAPASAEVLVLLAYIEDSMGQVDSALAHLRRAEVLDPRSTNAASVLGQHFLNLRHYPEAQSELRRGLTSAPSDLNLISLLAMAYLGQGNLPGAQNALQDVPATVDRSALVAQIAALYDYWVLDSADRALLLTLPVSSFDNNRWRRGIARAQAYWRSGDTTRARVWADTSRRAFEVQLRDTPYAPIPHGLLGLMLAYLGRADGSAREIEKAGALATVDFPLQWKQSLLAYAYIALADTSRTLDALEQTVKLPGPMSAAYFRINPVFASLHGNARFERLTADPTAATAPHD
jgi:tetratricopeptide (TPR) repeat protein